MEPDPVGVTDTDTHGLWRTAGAVWLAAGLDIYRVSRLLGHQSVTTTERAYAGLADGHLAAAMDLVDARGALPVVGAAPKTDATVGSSNASGRRKRQQ